MDLASYLLKPVQRMGKYALLLQQLMKAARQDVADLHDAEKMVRFQLRHGNDLLAMDSLRDCDVSITPVGFHKIFVTREYKVILVCIITIQHLFTVATKSE